MISQLMTQLKNTMKSEKHQQDKVMIIKLVVSWILLILKIQQIIFTGKIKATVANTRLIIYYILEQSKETKLEFAKGTTSFVTTYKWLNTVKEMLNYQIFN